MNKMKYKNNLIFIGILSVVFVLGFITSTVINKDTSPPIMEETEALINSYSNSTGSIDSVEQLSINYYDTANIEMLHYVLEYNNKSTNNLPDYYVTKFGDTIVYNKDNFFKYVALYTVADNLLESRKYIIHGLLVNIKTGEIEEIRKRSEH